MEDPVEDTSHFKRRLRTYNDFYAGPFLVIAESTNGNIIATKIAKSLIKRFDKDYVRATPMSRKKLKILMGSRDAANKLVKKQYEGLSFSIPQRLVESLGVTYIEPEVDDGELGTAKAFDKKKLTQDGNPAIVEFRRIIKKNEDGTTTPLYTVIFTFEGLVIPSHVEINKVLYAVKPYVYPTRQCQNCWRLGHNGKNCKSSTRCNNCLEEHPDHNHNCDEQPPQCVNCNGSHKANDKRCPKIMQKRKNDENRQAAYSQGVNDWFCAPGVQKSSPAAAQSSGGNLFQMNDNEQPSSSFISTNVTIQPSQKRRLNDTDWNDEPPQPDVNISEGVCNSIQSSIASSEVLDIVGEVLKVAIADTESRAKTQELVLTRISDVINNSVREYLGSLRL